MKKIILALLVTMGLSTQVGAEEEINMFPLMDLDNSGDISSGEFNAFVEKIVTQKLQQQGVFGNIAIGSPNIRVYKEEIVKGMLNGTKHFFELQDKNADLIITRDEYNNSLFLPLMKIGE